MKKKRLRKDPEGNFFLKLLKIMKLSLFIVCFSVFSAFASESYSQTTKLSLSLNNTSISDVLKKIEDQSEFRFFYSAEINTNKKVSITADKSDIQNILDEIFTGTDVAYKVVGRQVALFNKNDNAATVLLLQSKQVKGLVVNETGEPIPGVTIIVKGTSTGTVTDFDGNYSLNGVPENSTLVFSFIGMIPQEIVVSNQSTINITLKADLVGVEEVVVIGYGTRQKKHLIGAVDQVSSSIIED